MVVTITPSCGRPFSPVYPEWLIYQPWLTHFNRQARLMLEGSLAITIRHKSS